MQRLLTTLFILAGFGFVQLQAQTHELSGSIRDCESKEVLPFTTVSVMEADTVVMSNADGEFFLRFKHVHELHLRVTRVGYAHIDTVLQAERGQHALRLEVNMCSESAQSGQVLVVESSTSYHPGADSETIADHTQMAAAMLAIPGVQAEGMTETAIRPIARGNNVQRLTIIDGNNAVNDFSSAGKDHEVLVGNVQGRSVALLRNVHALAYSTGIHAGVVRVKPANDEIPQALLGEVLVNSNSRLDDASMQSRFVVPFDNSSIEFQGGFARLRGIETPTEFIPELQRTAWSASSEFKHFDGHAKYTLGTSILSTDNTLPGGILGGHPEPVEVKADRLSLVGSIEKYDISWCDVARIDAIVATARNKEFENGGALGSDYKSDSFEVRAMADAIENDIFDDASVGISVSASRNLHGGFVYTPDYETVSSGVYVSAATEVGHTHVDYGMRLNISSFSAEEARTFIVPAASVQATHHINKNTLIFGALSLGGRTPSGTELFSQGPHLASFEYEVGNIDLDAEVALHAEHGLEYSWSWGSFAASVYATRYFTYIESVRNGDTNWSTLLPIAAQSNEQAWLYGGESVLDISLSEDVTLQHVTEIVIGQNTSENRPLSNMSPITSSLELVYTPLSKLKLTLGAKAFAKQTRLGPGELETPGALVANTGLSYQWNTGLGVLHSELQAFNIFDTTYYNHLLATKSSFSEAGRTLVLSLQLHIL